MKPVHFLPPAVALVIAAGWIGSQRQSIAILEQESALLQKHIAAARSAGIDSDTANAKPDAPGITAKAKEPIDWKKVAAQFDEMRKGGGMGDMRTFMRLRNRLMAMDKEELVAALEEIAALDLPEESRAVLEQLLIAPLIEKDPEFALSKFLDRLHDERNSVSWQLSGALAEWAKKNPAAATAWFDQQIAAGTFDSKSLDGKSQSRMQFEGSLIGTLLSSNPEAAALRLAALPEDQRRDVLQYHTSNTLKQEDQLAYANLVRKQLPEKEQADTIASLVSRLPFNDNDYSVVTGYMDRIEATPAERSACIDRTAESRFQRLSYQRKITGDDIEKLREWTNSQSPEFTDRTTGKALASALQSSNGKTEFSDLADLAVQYHDTSGSDEILAPLLQNWRARDNKNKERARDLAEKISDETLRKQIQEQLQ